jgi:hypothetical protein
VVAEAESPAIGVRCRFHWGCAAAGVYGRLPVTAWRETGIGHYRVFAISEPQGDEEVRSQSALDEAGGSSSERSGEDSSDPGKTSVREEQFMRFICRAVRHTRDSGGKHWPKGLEILVGFP